MIDLEQKDGGKHNIQDGKGFIKGYKESPFRTQHVIKKIEKP